MRIISRDSCEDEIKAEMRKIINRDEPIVVIVTGANNGIGFYLTKALLEDGYLVAGFDIENNHLSELQKSHPDTIMVCKTDVTKDAEVNSSVQSVLLRWRKIDILVNNACLALFSPFDEKEIEQTRQEFEVNYYGYIRMIAAVLPSMKKRGKGIIHNVSSGVGITGFPGIYGYSSSKGAIEALTLTLSFELEKCGIVVNTVHPPLTNTKSAAPLGIPAEVMEDPSRVGYQLARKILSTKPVITPNFKTAVYLFSARRFPHFIGRLMGKMTEKQQSKNLSATPG